MQPYFQNKWVAIYQKDCRDMSELPDGSVDLVVTDPPYGISFMGKDWDRALPNINIWRECLRVLKPGAFAFVMSIPRADCLSMMIVALEDASFNVGFSPIYWAYASGFPKAMAMGKAVQKKILGVPKGGANPLSPSHGKYKGGCSADNVKGQGFGAGAGAYMEEQGESFNPELTDPQAKALDGSYGGFQPKPAIEVIIVCMKPLSEKTFVDQALNNRHGITWLDDCKIPYESEEDRGKTKVGFPSSMPVRDGWHEHDENFKPESNMNQLGRFTANLLVENDVLNDGKVTKSGKDAVRRQEGMFVEHKLGGLGNRQV